MAQVITARILVVEDDPRVQEVLELQLHDLGFQVVRAADGEEGMRRVADPALDLDVILLDLNLPKMHGLEVLDHVARLRPRVPVIVLTGYSNVDVAADVMRRGAFYYLTKPVNRHRMEAEIQRALDYRALLLDRERLAEENRRYQQGLERMVEQKSAELEQAHQRLLDVQSSLARADKADTLEIAITSVVHEIRNPLSVVIASVELARLRGNTDPHVTEALDAIWAAGRQIDGILSQTRGLGPARAPQWERVVVDEVLETAVALTRAHFVRAGVHARVRNEGPPRIIADRGRMLQVLLNLVLNACQAMGAGGELTLAALPSEDPDFLRLEVRDTGPGMPAHLLDDVLRPFVTTRSEGTGLGLSIAREICEHHGGFLLLDSEVGRGTTAVMLLPLQPELGVFRNEAAD